MAYTDFLKQQCYIDGKWCDADSGATFEVTDPGSGKVLGTVPKMGKDETARAIDAAEAALPGWRAKTAGERAKLLRKLYELMMEHQDDLGELLSREQGKPFAEGKGEIAYGAGFIEWFGEEGKRAYGDVIPSHAADRRIVVIKQGVGVVGAITPWNFPNAMITRKLGPALAAGCTIVIKPASATPYSALAIAALCEMAGIPAGVVNVVTGSAGQIGSELTSNPKVAKITFTGSTEIGRDLLRESAETIKKCSMELGGNAPFLVFDDADVDAAIDGAMISKFRNGGQTCVCTNRFYVQDGVYDEFVEKLAKRVSTMKVGYGMDSGTDIGPMIDEKAVEKVEEHLEDAKAGGATVLAGGQRNALGGTFFNPTVIAGVKPDMKIAREETFGPLAGVIRFKDEADAIAMANDTEFGLASYFYARDLSRVWRVAEALEAGMVGINTGLISTEVAPFGGVKQSGLGREGSHYGLDDFMEVKYLCMGIQPSA
ncbi:MULTISPECIES: NAD-dependent succinate-semialdehyde dehydrogenase [Novosphingobium]|uniref:Succinate-semialdehyde dehydrogenase / glutarate-semialdehyde dehydrogenase n=1 Tax=Novosphingobium mathurense TaxID=428990 RepID=A0A1U6IFH6_9SPHN|nr:MULTISPECIES: NAD-dependent succinate-semialdehyde dehydrogenase [Novosphingobium]CDO37411.1 Succinate-semialdehyde dehydrogenase (NADP+) (SSDH) [Novosphingobium sp. KN65.2]SLK06788.1 succinate-semialdehyde dehydrogenase / glutarate-semialdehyde dehydrogenase [Novosphingobium mathurense]